MATGNGKSKKKKIVIFSILLVILVGGAAMVFMGSNRETILNVQSEKISRRNITQIVTATGKIQPEVMVKINAEVSGELTDLPVREGQRVRKGQLLLRIKPDAYQAQFDRSQAALAISDANLKKADADNKRVTGLYEKKLVSDAEMDIAKANFQSAKAQYDQSQASIKEARETLSKTSIYSPMDGVVSQLKSEQGERVSGSTFTQGTEIMTIADLSRMEARVDVGENDIVMVSIGDTARVEVDSYTNRKFVGTVSRIANTAKSTGLGTQDQVTNFEVRILMAQPDGIQFRPGMSMSADIETETHANVLAVPIQSVTVRMPKETQGPKEDVGEGEAQFAGAKTSNKKKEDDKLEEVVFVVDNGKVKTVPVKRGLSDDAYVEVSGDKLEGAEVVSGPFKAINRDLEKDAKVKVDNKQGRKTGANNTEKK